jgi:hypothetical protein
VWHSGRLLVLYVGLGVTGHGNGLGDIQRTHALLIFVAVPRDKGDGALAGAQHAGHQGRLIRPRRVIEGQLDRSPVVTSVGFEALSQPA